MNRDSRFSLESVLTASRKRCSPSKASSPSRSTSAWRRSSRAVRHLCDTEATAFLFDPNYHVDLILFRELLGTVRNAVFIMPSLCYELTGRIRF